MPCFLRIPRDLMALVAISQPLAGVVELSSLRVAGWTEVPTLPRKAKEIGEFLKQTGYLPPNEAGSFVLQFY